MIFHWFCSAIRRPIKLIAEATTEETARLTLVDSLCVTVNFDKSLFYRWNMPHGTQSDWFSHYLLIFYHAGSQIIFTSLSTLPTWDHREWKQESCEVVMYFGIIYSTQTLLWLLLLAPCCRFPIRQIQAEWKTWAKIYILIPLCCEGWLVLNVFCKEQQARRLPLTMTCLITRYYRCYYNWHSNGPLPFLFSPW